MPPTYTAVCISAIESMNLQLPFHLGLVLTKITLPKPNPFSFCLHLGYIPETWISGTDLPPTQKISQSLPTTQTENRLSWLEVCAGLLPKVLGTGVKSFTKTNVVGQLSRLWLLFFFVVGVGGIKVKERGGGGCRPQLRTFPNVAKC